MNRLKIALFVVLCAGFNALFGGVCVEIDETKDQLQPPDRQSAKLYVEGVFTEQKKAVGGNCEEKFVFYHVKMGDSITVFMAAADNNVKKMQVNSINELPRAYTALVISFVSGKPIELADKEQKETPPAVVKEETVKAVPVKEEPKKEEVAAKKEEPQKEDPALKKPEPKQEEPAPKVENGGIFFAKIGLSLIVPTSEAVPTPYFGFGYRYELGSIAFECSFLNTSIETKKAPETDSKYKNSTTYYYSMTRWLQLNVFYFVSSKSIHSFYLGGGASLESQQVKNGYDNSGEKIGAGGNIIFGYEFFRASRTRIFLQLEVNLPFFNTKLSFDEIPSKSFYIPGGSFVAGIGF